LHASGRTEVRHGEPRNVMLSGGDAHQDIAPHVSRSDSGVRSCSDPTRGHGAWHNFGVALPSRLSRQHRSRGCSLLDSRRALNEAEGVAPTRHASTRARGTMDGRIASATLAVARGGRDPGTALPSSEGNGAQPDGGGRCRPPAPQRLGHCVRVQQRDLPIRGARRGAAQCSTAGRHA